MKDGMTLNLNLLQRLEEQKDRLQDQQTTTTTTTRIRKAKQK